MSSTDGPDHAAGAGGTARVVMLVRREGAYSNAVLEGVRRYAVDAAPHWVCEGADPTEPAVDQLARHVGRAARRYCQPTR